ncbi:DUF6281 family protein [Streptomyces sp. NPDC006458]|uniref:DUF6281 family protein n=1 Tax=Streptomyces sp. NPDC006458 TaxID=3154302 RepID=UPI0033A19C41
MTSSKPAMGMLLAAALMASAAACTTDSSNGATSNACVHQFIYEDRSYQDVANVEFAVGDKLGKATQPPCDDTGGQDEVVEPEPPQTAYAVQGLSPNVAIAVGDTPEEAKLFAAYTGSKLPPEVQKLIDNS